MVDAETYRTAEKRCRAYLELCHSQRPRRDEELAGVAADAQFCHAAAVVFDDNPLAMAGPLRKQIDRSKWLRSGPSDAAYRRALESHFKIFEKQATEGKHYIPEH